MKEDEIEQHLHELGLRLDRLREALEWDKALGGRRLPGAVPLGGPARHARHDVLVAYGAFMSLASELTAKLDALGPDHHRARGRLEQSTRACRDLFREPGGL
jgi:hypothetical protein